MAPRALEGLRVIECGQMVAAAYTAKLMADLGADVIKVEEPPGDLARTRGPFPDGVPHPEKSGLFLYLNCNKRGVTIDLKRPEGQELLRRLVSQADVLVHNYPPPEMERRRLDYEWLAEANPRLVMTSITPFGLNGPYRDYKAHDITVMAAGGWAWINGWPGHPEEPPLKAYGQQTEYQSGAAAAVATMGALLARQRDGRGQHVEVNAQAVVASFLEMTFTAWPYMHVVSVRWGQRPIQPIDFFRCKDGWIFVLCVEEHQWKAFVELMGNPEWAEWEIFKDRISRAQNYDVLRPYLEDWISNWTVEELYRAANERRVPFAPASTMGDLLRSEHLRARGFFVTVDHPVAGRYEYPGAPYRHSLTPWELRTPAPTLGQHNDEVFRGLLGLSSSEIESLKASGVI
ncbi:MAG: CoA transferase [Dehalococcoidia bacterium]|jgi:crotonobetainyl-CoA:carnitine CoA-transferase CaiB-like acyl-CoA transferase|nr:CoA transferase [Dehalococcoidia bacterium]MDW8009681.1 CoA transferase [Chloroflexota bacterium]WBU15435.1 succinyl-CoA--L-malate CoA-transferase alpha subunit [uncultured bacterium]